MGGSGKTVAIDETGQGRIAGAPKRAARMVDVSAISLDAFNFPRLDLIKMDVEGMELEALAGATKSIQLHRPMMLIEALKVDAGKLRAWLEELNYSVLQSGINLLAIHREDECLKHLKIGVEIRLNSSLLSMILSENRLPLFGIML